MRNAVKTAFTLQIKEIFKINYGNLNIKVVIRVKSK